MSFTREAGDSPGGGRWSAVEAAWLHPAAAKTADTRGRRYRETAHPWRTPYMRDRSRVVHASAFRRLMHKTQVFVVPVIDHQRTRLTHTLEVAQIARTIARGLRLNEDLTETVALAHDLGHPPFGHAGERALATLLADHGGFEHNRHSLRLVEKLEQRYPNFPGLNLSYEVLESIALRSHRRDYPELADFGPPWRTLAESQIVDQADSITYTAHDLDDALRAGLIDPSDLDSLALWRVATERAHEHAGRRLEGKTLTRSAIRLLLDLLISSLLAESERRLASCTGVADVKHAGEDVVALEPALAAGKRELHAFLFDRVYRHEQVLRATQSAEELLAQLFEKLLAQPVLLPAKYQRRLDDETRPVVVGDYLAGMTDQFAQRAHAEWCWKRVDGFGETVLH